MLALSFLAAGCSDGEPAPTATPTAIDTLAEVRRAREAVQQPAVDLHLAAQRVVGLVAEQRAATDPPATRLSTLAELPSTTFDDLGAAVVAVEDVTLDGRSEAVGRARDALAAAAKAGRQVQEAALLDLADEERAAEVEVALLDMAARWEAPGSRSQQLDRFAALAADADALAAELAAVDPVADCLTTFERRRAAAHYVGEATRELREHVEAYRGTAFDERRAELAEDPFGLELPLRDGDVAELGCWREAAPVVLAAAAIDAALARLEDALNPADATATPDS